FLQQEHLNLVLANRNTPDQGVLSGAAEEIDKAINLLSERGLSCKRLDVAAAFHSELIADAARPFADKLKTINFNPPRKQVFSNTSGNAYPESAAAVRELLSAQLASPVDFVTEIESMYQAGVRIFVEVGPGARLTGMVKATLGQREYQTLAIDSSNGKRSSIADLARALAKLSALGGTVDLQLWDPDFASTQAVNTKKKPGISVSLCGANYHKKPEKRPPLKIERVVQTEQKPQLSETLPIDQQGTAPQSQTGTFAAGQDLQAALRITQQSMQALQNLQEQTSSLHQQFLAGQQAATQSFMNLVAQQQQLIQGNPFAQASARVPSFAPEPPLPEPQAVTTAPSPAGEDPPVEKASEHQDTDIAPLLLAIIAEKTGYPVEMLELDMALDSDLGVDSIKRVEILSAIQAQVPDAPTIRPEDLAALQTLAQIVEYLNAGRSSSAPQEKSYSLSSGVNPDKIAATLLEVIAEKTGYPVEMLELEMALDSDLGIDSIKRVEILSALQEKLPEVPAVRPEDLGVLQTLGQIIDHLSQGRQQRIPITLPTPQMGQVDREKVAATLLEVIAEKTGYPVEMLELEMALDSDLGIDSIKRVEILSTLQERLPGAPAIKPEHLGTLQTVGQIVDFLASSPASEIKTKAAEIGLKAAPKSIRRQVLKAVPLAQNRPANRMNFPPGAQVWITDDGSALADAVCSEFTAHQLIPRKISLNDLESLEVSAQLSGLVILSPLKGSDDQFLKQAFKLVQRLGVALNKSAQQGGAFLTTVSRVNGRFGLPGSNQPVNDPLSGGLAGLNKTVALEWPSIHCRVLDLAMGMEIKPTVSAIVQETFTRSPIEVGITSRGLLALELNAETLDLKDSKPPVAEGELVVISGGARGVTAAVAVRLAARTQATLLLLGRSQLPAEEPDWLNRLKTEADIKKAIVAHAEGPLKPTDVAREYERVSAEREIRSTLDRILNAGGTPVYRSVDLRDGTAVSAIIEEVRQQYGPVKGIIHGAGVLADKLITEKTAEQFDQVYTTKVAGLNSLLNALGQDDVKFMALFSSSTGRFGRVGQADYAVANEILNKIADQQAELRPDCRVISLNWGPWDGGMVTPALKKLFAQEGIEVIDLETGAEYLVNELSLPPGQPVELVILGGDDGEKHQQQKEPQQNIHVSKAFDLDLSVAQFPFLKSHVIDGKAVLPMAFIIEWLAHGALHNNPGLKFQGLNDLRILKGIVLAADQSIELQVMTGKAIKSNDVHVVPVELSSIDAAGKTLVHARGRVVLATKLPELKAAATKLPLASYPHDDQQIYRSGRLFHGEDLQGIREILGCAPGGISALVKPAPQPEKWINQPLRNSWFADPLALDSSFQLMILWSFEQYQAGSLPVFAERYRQYQEKFPATGVEIRVRLINQDTRSAKADIDFVDPLDGQLVARIENYECIIDASLNATFQRNKLTGVA
ncbi:MAG: SDR family NAD(P)-dependent oxidoreductase, partial [Deltaproteobacteria bacterium]|nr:SDR family NAD(P)-dependent oxidoreductase [Deltaproteobacteria bacterium]